MGEITLTQESCISILYAIEVLDLQNLPPSSLCRRSTLLLLMLLLLMMMMNMTHARLIKPDTTNN